MAVHITKFKITLYVFFVLCAIGSIVAIRFAGDGGGSDDENFKPGITVWGSIHGETMDVINSNDSIPVYVTYSQMRPDNAYATFLESAANGQVPDVIIMRYADLGQFFASGRTVTIPYESYSERTYDDTFISGASMLKAGTGIAALPVFVDPLVMFYNRAILDNAGILYPMSRWSDAYTMSERLTERSGQLGVVRSTFGLGEATNITHSKDILSALFLQLGLQVATLDGGGGLASALYGQGAGSGASALRFYTSFADPAKNHYTWNRALPKDKDMFLAENLVYYFGKASEREELQRRNPNMSLDMALFPQASGDQIVTTGDLYVAIFPRGSANINAAVSYIYWLTNPQTITSLMSSGIYPFTPPVRAVLARPPVDKFSPIEYQSAIVSRFWHERSSATINQIFSDMISDVTTGRRSPEESVDRASARINEI